jgi:hypothetical protein
MSERFELFRFSLLERDQRDLFEPKEITRADWLRQVFSEATPFCHHGTEFHYAPALDHSDSNIIVGRVGKHVLREENLPPDEGLEDITRDTWLAAVMVLDPTDHLDGQKLAVQHIQNVGKPSSLVKQLTQAINDKYQGPYQIEPSQIVEAQSFWDYVKEYRGLITSISFDFISPNMIGADDEFHDEMREFRDNEKARKVKLILQNEDGINPETERVERAVNYALSESRGKVTAKARGKPSYSSSNEIKFSYVEDVKEKGAELVKVAKEFSNRILGRE